MPKVDFDTINFKNDDKLGREDSADLIMNYLLKQEESRVISVNSAWGTGKTWFAHMWKNKLRDEFQGEIIPIYYNAWDNDDYGDAFIPLLAAINEYLPDEGNKKETYLDAAKELFVSMISGPLKKMTFDMVDGKEIKEIYDKYKESLGSDFELAISDFQKQRELKKNFSNALKEFTLVDKEEHKNDEKKTKKIFIFIDELDRCRPTFAIETLERIKHYFGIKNVHFILMQDSEQLSHSVKVLYGNDCDTGGYLRRFIDFDFPLPQFDINLYLQNKINDDRKPFLDLAKIFNLSLRDINKFLIWFDFYIYNGIYTTTLKNNIKGYLFTYFALLKMKKLNNYNKLILKNEFVNDILNQEIPFKNEVSNSYRFVEDVFQYLNDFLYLSVDELIEKHKITRLRRHEIEQELNFIKNIPKLINVLDKISIYY